MPVSIIRNTQRIDDPQVKHLLTGHIGARHIPPVSGHSHLWRDWCKTGGASGCRIFSLLFLDRGWGVEWILRLAAAGGEGPCVDIMKISKPDDLGDIANLGLTLTEAKQLLARVQHEISAAQARAHATRRPVCPCRDGVCRVKDYRDHAVATLFGQVILRLRPTALSVRLRTRPVVYPGRHGKTKS